MMARNEPMGTWAVTFSFVMAMMLVVLPLPDWAMNWRPAWVMLVLIYWCMALPHKVGMGVGWSAGLFVDVLTGTLLGQHALGFAVVAYLTHHFYLQLRVRPVWQQSITIFFFVILAKILIIWAKGFQGLSTQDDALLTPALSSAIIWPWIFVMLRDLRRKYKVN